MADVAQCLNGLVTVGDVVRIVLPTPCCGRRDDVGIEYRVVFLIRAQASCSYCGSVIDGALCGQREGVAPPSGLLIRIDPPALPENVEDVAKVPA
jgi:hypothetical protein